LFSRTENLTSHHACCRGFGNLTRYAYVAYLAFGTRFSSAARGRFARSVTFRLEQASHSLLETEAMENWYHMQGRESGVVRTVPDGVDDDVGDGNRAGREQAVVERVDGVAERASQ
jgi:hypothetical protein